MISLRLLLVFGIAIATAQAQDSKAAAERRVLLREVSTLRANLDMPELPADTSKLTIEMLRSEHAMLTSLRAEKRAETNRAKREQEIKLRQAEGAVKIGATKARREQPSAEAITALKQRFPARASGNARVFIPKSGQGGRPYIISSSMTEIQGGPKISRQSATTHVNGRVDTIQYDAPSDDVWSWYRGTFQTTTLAALPQTLKMAEERMAADVRKMQSQTGALSGSAQAQAQHTLYWFDKELKPYMQEWRQLVR